MSWNALCTEPSKITDLKVDGYNCKYVSSDGNKSFTFEYSATQYTLNSAGKFLKGGRVGSWETGQTLRKGTKVTCKKEGKPFEFTF